MSLPAYYDEDRQEYFCEGCADPDDPAVEPVSDSHLADEAWGRVEEHQMRRAGVINCEACGEELCRV